MATTLQIKYYNTYILKKINQIWNASTGTMDRTNAQYDWYVEESRIKGDFNGNNPGLLTISGKVTQAVVSRTTFTYQISPTANLSKCFDSTDFPIYGSITIAPDISIN